VSVSGVSITRTTGTAANTAAGGSGNASKAYVDARISLDPLTATNPLNTNHTVTVHVEVNPGTGWVDAAAGDVSWTLTDAGSTAVFDAALSTCDNDQPDPGDNLNNDGECTIVFSSATPGTTTVNASVDVVVGGVAITRTTGTAANTAAGGTGNATKTWVGGGATLLIIDEDSIDNGIRFNAKGGKIVPNGPNFFTPKEVNDDKPSHTQRDVLRYFAENVGQTLTLPTITLLTGQTGDEGWFAPTCIPQKWISGTSNTCLPAGASRDTAIDNYFGLNGPGAIPPQSRLDKIPAVMPLRARGLVSLTGKTICAVVYDSDISINYPKSTWPFTEGNLKGETLGIVAFDVVEVRRQDQFSSSTLPEVQITIRNASVCGTWSLFNAPVPRSSSVPNDIDPLNLAGLGSNGYRQFLTLPGEPLFF
jgi:hypothetical protein